MYQSLFLKIENKINISSLEAHLKAWMQSDGLFCQTLFQSCSSTLMLRTFEQLSYLQIQGILVQVKQLCEQRCPKTQIIPQPTLINCSSFRIVQTSKQPYRACSWMNSLLRYLSFLEIYIKCCNRGRRSGRKQLTCPYSSQDESVGDTQFRVYVLFQSIYCIIMLNKNELQPKEEGKEAGMVPTGVSLFFTFHTIGF